MDIKMVPFSEEVNSLFVNGDAKDVWDKAEEVIRLINPDYDFSRTHIVFADMIAMFRGQYSGYAQVKTPYHDMAHTLHVFLCSLRLMHGVHVAGTPLSDTDVFLVTMSTLMHDIGYAQTQTEEAGTGAQHTQCHVARGIEFMRKYVAEKGWTDELADQLEPLIRSTDPGFPFAQIPFQNEHMRLLGQLVATSDLVGQMADRTYLEKLLFLYLEFKEAHFGNYQNVHDMLRQTKRFYEITREKLDVVYEGLYANLSAHFKETMGVDNNYYLESIEKNIEYLTRVTQLEEVEHLNMLKRGGITDKVKTMPDFKVA